METRRSRRSTFQKKDVLPSNNPAEKRYWQNEPKNAQEMNDWIEFTKENLLQHLKDKRDEKKSQKVKGYIKTETANIQRYFESTWAPRTDVLTGNMWDAVEQETMQADMDNRHAVLKAYHAKHKTALSISEYVYALQYWEDFLYYQNEWNRRHHEKKYDPTETSWENKERKRLSDWNTVENAARSEAGDKFQSGYWDYLNWRDHMIELYQHYGVGNRSNIPNPLEPEQFHRYSGSVREVFRNSNTRAPYRGHHISSQRVESLKRKFPFHEIIIDEEVLSTKRRDTDVEFLAETKAPGGHILPEGHIYHAAVTEKPTHITSFESSKVYKARRLVQDKLVKGTRHPPFDGLVAEDKRKRYRMTTKEAMTQEFFPQLDEDGNLLGRDRDGKWQGINLRVKNRVPATEIDGEGRPVEDNRTVYKIKRIYTRNEGEGIEQEEQADGRQERSRKARTFDQFSDNGSNSEPESDPPNNDLESDDEDDLFTETYNNGRTHMGVIDSAGTDTGGADTGGADTRGTDTEVTNREGSQPQVPQLAQENIVLDPNDPNYCDATYQIQLPAGKFLQQDRIPSLHSTSVPAGITLPDPAAQKFADQRTLSKGHRWVSNGLAPPTWTRDNLAWTPKGVFREFDAATGAYIKAHVIRDLDKLLNGDPNNAVFRRWMNRNIFDLLGV
ncbi:hypothetical protein B0J11DRAFT_502169 [Dendryphion nanum]|uniref:Uncharacterized protein n=1 Tax=Dendryphion nanum TaxID=256645 RepID=A0A9P9ECY3_9PLEO|nr:hypothetical protein B0J11DRAFT_502169 [Dendryphion nanum]